MNIHYELEKIDVIILCGGRGKRLSSVLAGQPKPLAKIGDKAFLDILIDSVLGYGFKRIILSVGYRKEQIMKHYDHKKRPRLEFCEEETLLGTGGALKKAFSLIKSESFLVMNGDSICEVNFGEFYRFHVEKRSLLSMVLAKSTLGQKKQECGNVRIDGESRITGFSEKISKGNGALINAGIYFMQSDIFFHMPSETFFSLEYDFFPAILDKRCYGFICDNELIDIGTPERYEEAVQLLDKST